MVALFRGGAYLHFKQIGNSWVSVNSQHNRPHHLQEPSRSSQLREDEFLPCAADHKPELSLHEGRHKVGES